MSKLRSEVSLHCKKCTTELAKREILMLATMPPSQQHLAVKEEMEDWALKKILKRTNPKGGRSARYCPFLAHCRNCDNHVGNFTHVSSKVLICFKVENVYVSNGVEKIVMRKLSPMASKLQALGVEVVKYSPFTFASQSPKQSSEPMKYCDTTGLTCTSHEMDSLTRQVPRSYQRELFLAAMRGNTLICLPTGSGKTLVAAMVFSCMKKLNPNKLMVFIVDRIPLAYQQSAYIKYQLPHLTVETLTGEMTWPQKGRIHEALAKRTVDILVLTHQIFLDSLPVKDSTIRFSNISVLCFDEAHHCAGGNPYNQIMSDFYTQVSPESFKPLVLGLTASPAGDITTERTIEKLEKLLINLQCKIATPVESQDLVAHVNAPNTSYDIVTTTESRQVILERRIHDHITDLQRNHVESTPGCEQALRGLFVYSTHFRGALRNLIARCHEDHSKIKVLIVGEHMMRMLSVVDISQVLCYKDALVCLNDCIHDITQAISPSHSALKKLIARNEGPFEELRRYAAEAVSDDSPMSDRYQCLEFRIREFVRRVQEDESSRGIIFVSMRRTAFKLCERLRVNAEVAERLNPAAFVGHGDGSYDGMAWLGEQEVLLRDFRSGVIKLLVSTSVLEEGLDVPVCNLVIRFEGAATLRAFVQSRGRASRRPGSDFVVICNEKEKADAQNLVEREENMKCAVAHVMETGYANFQARKFNCEVKRPDFTLPQAKADVETRTGAEVERYRPSIMAVVQYFSGNVQNLEVHVEQFLTNAFDLLPARLSPTESLSTQRICEKEALSEVAFLLQPKGNVVQEFRSKAEFACHVTQVWCGMLTDVDEQPLPVWLRPLLPQKSHEFAESSTILQAASFFLGTFLTRNHFQYEWPSDTILRKVQLRFDHSFNMVTVLFVVRGRNYKIELRYDEYEDFILVDDNTSNGEMTARIFLTVKHPARLYRQVLDDDGDDNDDDDDDHENDDNNVVDTMEDEGLSDVSDSESESQGFSTDDEYPDIVRNLHERSLPEFVDIPTCWERVAVVENYEKAWGECFTYCFRISSENCVPLRLLLATLDQKFGKKSFYSRVENTFGRFPETETPNELGFDVMYALEGIVKSHPSVRGRLHGSVLANLLRNRNPNVVLACLEKLEKALEQDLFCNPEKTLETLLTRGIGTKSRQKQNLVPSHCALIRRVVVTPTRLLLHPPEVMVKNRVLRHYATADFLCVSIRDENLSKLSLGRGSIDILLDNMNVVLNEGLSIAGKTYQFLGSSNSQLRNHSCWFVGPSLSPDDVRQWMGDFGQIK